MMRVEISRSSVICFSGLIRVIVHPEEALMLRMIPVSLLILMLQSAGQQPAPIPPVSATAGNSLFLHGTVKDPYGAVTYAQIQISEVEQDGSPDKVDHLEVKARPIVLDTNPYGQYSIRLPAGRYEICVTGREFIKSCRMTHADETGDVTADFSLDSDPVLLKALQPAESEVMDQRLAILAGKDAINCGSSPVKGNPEGVNRCARDAFRRHKAFYVRYGFQGIDSEISDGLAFDGSGAGYGVIFDSMGFSDEGLEKDASMPDGSHTVILRCPSPVRLRKTRTGTLSCFKKSKPFLIGDSM